LVAHPDRPNATKAEKARNLVVPKNEEQEKLVGRINSSGCFRSTSQRVCPGRWSHGEFVADWNTPVLSFL
jgi:hypothetical protein